MKVVIWVSTTIAMWLVCVNAWCDGAQGFLSNTARTQDVRLERKVSVRPGQMPLAALMATLTKQSGVLLTIDVREAVSGAAVFVALKDIPLADAMNSIWSLLSYSGAALRWQADGSEGGLRYALEMTSASRQFPLLLKAQIQRKFETHAATMMGLALMTPQERKTHVKELTSSWLLSSDDTAKDWIADEVEWSGLRTFAESVPPADQLQVLRSQKRVDVQVRQLSAAGRDFISSYMNRLKPSSTSPQGVTTPLPEPDQVGFVTGQAMGRETLTPSLYIYIHGRSVSFMGGFALELGIKDWIGQQWMLPGDTRDDSLEDSVLAKPLVGKSEPADAPGEGEVPANYQAVLGLKEMARSTPISCLALLDESGTVPRVAYGQTVKAYLAKATLNCSLNKKWRGRVLLLSAPTRVIYDSANLPYRFIKNLTHSGVQGSNFLSLAEMAEMQSALTKGQLETNSRKYALLGAVQAYAPLLSYYSRDHDIARTGGTALGPELSGALRQTFGLPTQHPLFSGEAAWVRLSTVDDSSSDVPTRHVRLEYMHADRKWVFLHGFTQVGTADDPDRAK